MRDRLMSPNALRKFFASIFVTYFISHIDVFEGECILESQIKVSGEARVREPYGSHGDDETECLTTLIKRHANFTVRKWNITPEV